MAPTSMMDSSALQLRMVSGVAEPLRRTVPRSVLSSWAVQTQAQANRTRTLHENRKTGRKAEWRRTTAY